jgi:hypothetical protein
MSNVLDRTSPNRGREMESIELRGHPIVEERRKYRIEVNQTHAKSIDDYRKKNETFLKMHNNTANKEVWKVYDHLTDDLFSDLFSDVTKKMNRYLDEYLEKIIKQEF